MPAAHDPDTNAPAPAAEAAQRALAQLEHRLEALARSGVRHLNLPAPPPGARQNAARAASPQSPHPEPSPRTESPDRPARTTKPAAAAQTGRPPSTEPAAPAPTAKPPPAPADAPPDPASLATLESLRFQYKDCRACRLSETRTRLVFGVGHDHPRVMFIGEGPGADEDVQGLPFVGRAGRLLTGLIQAMGLVREDVYITNVVKCRPPGNRNPEPSEVTSCSPILQRQIELLDPRLIVTLGNVPLKALNPRAGGITRERGRRFTYGRWTVLPTFHPSYLLRNPAAIGDCWGDLRQALDWAYADAGETTEA